MRRELAPLAAFLLAACGGPAPGEGMDAPMASEPVPEVVPARDAVMTADIPTIDPGTMNEAEIEKVLPEGPRCSFVYTAASPPVLAGALPAGGGPARGVVKIHGRLVALEGAVQDFDALRGGTRFASGDVSLEVSPDPQKEGRVRDGVRRRPADMVFRLEEGLTVGYRGWWRCPA
ncbi:hypothetical protein [Parvularcula dongshanensis]|uniref:Lipoprotein n=1 Tax=Parvularcula dongshanensis TaxID=1173995 RepID=A0A840I1H5_9PROT|nr:hypothetical protein [Parvularcula dongshanensis]MBB4658133.1 hypothetical protein [Parvularcula dongshanensis]